jgi:hypothetical protein
MLLLSCTVRFGALTLHTVLPLSLYNTSKFSLLNPPPSATTTVMSNLSPPKLPNWCIKVIQLHTNQRYDLSSSLLLLLIEDSQNHLDHAHRWTQDGRKFRGHEHHIRTNGSRKYQNFQSPAAPPPADQWSSPSCHPSPYSCATPFRSRPGGRHDGHPSPAAVAVPGTCHWWPLDGGSPPSLPP